MRLAEKLVFPHLLKTFLRVTPPHVCLHYLCAESSDAVKDKFPRWLLVWTSSFAITWSPCLWAAPRHRPSLAPGHGCAPAAVSLGTATHRCFQFYIRMCLNCRNQTLIFNAFLSVVGLSPGCRVWPDVRGRQCSADLLQKSSGMFKSAVSAQAHL